MFCEECGTQRENDALFCEECGTPYVINEESSNSQPTNDPNANLAQPSNSNEALRENGTPTQYTRMHMVFFASILVILGCSYTLYGMLQTICSPMYIAESYVLARESQNFVALTSFFDSDIINNDYKGIYEQPSLDIEVTNIELTIEDQWYDYVDISYTSQYGNTEETSSGEFSLMKLDSKKWFIFDNWIINPDTVIATDATLVVYEGAVASIGSVNLEDFAIDIKSYQGTIIYTLPDVLTGKYTIETLYPYGDTNENILMVKSSSGNTCTISSSEETKEGLRGQAYDALIAFVDNAFNKNGYDALFKVYNFDNSYKKYFTTADYNQAIGNGIFSNYPFTPINYEMTNITSSKGTVSYNADNGNYEANVYFSGDTYTVGNREYSDLWGRTTNNIEEIESSYSNFTVYFTYDDEWIISDVKPAPYY